MPISSNLLLELFQTSDRSIDLAALNTLYDEAPHFYPLLCCYPSFDIPFWKGVAEQAGQGQVLDLGCGTGRVAVPLALSGVSVVGVDRAIGMLHLARKNVEEAGVSALFLKQDFRALDLGEKFSLAIAPANVVNHCFSSQDLDLFLDAVRRHLTPGGRLIFSARNQGMGPSGAEPITLHTEDQAREGLHIEWRSLPLDHQTQLSLAVFSVTRDGERSSFYMGQRIFSPAELQDALRRRGLRVDRMYGDFDMAALRTDSPHMIVICSAE